MPGYLIGTQRLLFLHIPKCGGSSLEAALRGAGTEFLFDSRFHTAADRFSACSAQHLHQAALARLFPPGFFDLSVAVVRHPLERLLSEYRFRRKIKERTRRATRPAALDPEPEAFEPWLDYALGHVAAHPYLFDNHLRPQSDFLADGVEVFRLEDGLDRVTAHLSKALGCAITLPKARKLVSPKLEITVTTAARERVAAHYAQDYARLGYAP